MVGLVILFSAYVLIFSGPASSVIIISPASPVSVQYGSTLDINCSVIANVPPRTVDWRGVYGDKYQETPIDQYTTRLTALDIKDSTVLICQVLYQNLTVEEGKVEIVVWGNSSEPCGNGQHPCDISQFPCDTDNQVSCGDGLCVSLTARCDGQYQCANRKDEDGCIFTLPSSEGSPGFSTPLYIAMGISVAFFLILLITITAFCRARSHHLREMQTHTDLRRRRSRTNRRFWQQSLDRQTREQRDRDTPPSTSNPTQANNATCCVPNLSQNIHFVQENGYISIARSPPPYSEIGMLPTDDEPPPPYSVVDRSLDSPCGRSRYKNRKKLRMSPHSSQSRGSSQDSCVQQEQESTLYALEETELVSTGAQIHTQHGNANRPQICQTHLQHGNESLGVCPAREGEPVSVWVVESNPGQRQSHREVNNTAVGATNCTGLVPHVSQQSTGLVPQNTQQTQLPHISKISPTHSKQKQQMIEKGISSTDARCSNNGEFRSFSHSPSAAVGQEFHLSSHTPSATECHNVSTEVHPSEPQIAVDIGDDTISDSSILFPSNMSSTVQAQTHASTSSTPQRAYLETDIDSFYCEEDNCLHSGCSHSIQHNATDPLFSPSPSGVNGIQRSDWGHDNIAFDFEMTI